jgi:hypothetical protein
MTTAPPITTSGRPALSDLDAGWQLNPQVSIRPALETVAVTGMIEPRGQR